MSRGLAAKAETPERRERLFGSPAFSDSHLGLRSELARVHRQNHFGRTLNRCLVRRTGAIRCESTPFAEATPYATRNQNQLSVLSLKFVRTKTSKIPHRVRGVLC